MATHRFHHIARGSLKRSLFYAEEANNALMKATVIQGVDADGSDRIDTFDAIDALYKAIIAMDEVIALDTA